MDTKTSSYVALIVRVTGMVGLSLVEALKKPPISGTNSTTWKVYGLARSPTLPNWYHSSLLDHFVPLDLLDSESTTKKLSPLSSEITHIFWVALQVAQTEEYNVTINCAMLTNVLNAMKSVGSSSKLKHITLQTGTKHYMGPIFYPNTGKQVLVLDQDPPFKEDLLRLPYPNFYYALEDLMESYKSSITYSIHRTPIIIGASSRSSYNLLLSLAIYEAICRFEGLPFQYPGSKYTWDSICDMSGLLAEQHVWAATTENAKNQAFNCSNGDVFSWKRLWKELSEIFDVGFVEFDENDEFDWAAMMRSKGEVWDEIVEKCGLFKTKLEEVIYFDGLKVILNFEFQHVCSMNKSREFGF